MPVQLQSKRKLQQMEELIRALSGGNLPSLSPGGGGVVLFPALEGWVREAGAVCKK